MCVSGRTSQVSQGKGPRVGKNNQENKEIKHRR